MIRKLIFFALLVFSLTTLFAQSRPKVDDTLQKANKRPPQTIVNQPKPETQTNPENPPVINQNPVVNPSNDETVGGVEDDDVLRINTNLVTIPVKVSDRSGRYIAGLTKGNFKVFEDGKEQEIAYFSDAEQPFTVALVLDMSYSSTFKIKEIHSAAIDFINQLHSKDKVMVVSFDEEVHILCEPTNDKEILKRAIRSTKIASGTSLYEAVDQVVNKHLKKIAGRKAVVLFTDGVDTTSRRASDATNLNDAYELDALIYPIQYDTYKDVQAIQNDPTKAPQRSPIPSTTGNPFPIPFPLPTISIGGGQGAGNGDPRGTSREDYLKAGEYLQELANRTSGRVYQAGTIDDLSTAFANIAAELRQLYSLGFYPNEEKAGKRRQLKVRVDQKGLVVRARDSYVVAKKEKSKKQTSEK